MITIDLNGEWRTEFFPEGREQEITVMTSTVPGNLENDLFQAGHIGDPYVRLNAMQLRPYEFYDWRMSREFELQEIGRRMELAFEGIDCFAAIRLNGHEVGQTANAFIRHVFEVTEWLQVGKNRLEVIIFSANNAVRPYRLKPYGFSAYPYNYESLRARKPAHSWGWDITPRMALGGLWRPVCLREIPAVRFTGNYLQTLPDTTTETAKMLLTYNFETADRALEGYQLKITGRCGDSTFEQERAVWFTSGVVRFEIPRPQLWWPHGYGNAHLYEVKYELYKHGVRQAEETAEVGLRTIRLNRAESVSDGNEPDFVFVVNGVRIMVKGTNWVPADALHSRDAERIPRIIAMAEDLHCNMLRVWGGGVYEPHLFYQLCDRKGILVWQDFMLGCANYPQDEEFLSAIRTEADAVVTDLRQHACIAVWAGDNECDLVSSWAGFTNLDPNRNRITRRVLPELLLESDPLRAYLPSSPYLSPETFRREQVAQKGAGELGPEQHLWGPRNYFKSDFYRRSAASFASEIGYHGCPGVSSIRKFVSAKQIWPWQNNREWDFHASNPFLADDATLNFRTVLMANQIRELFGTIPENLEDFVLASQICQAEAKKFFIESARGRKPRMTGLLWWNLMDCWPQFSDAIVDYYFNRKLAYYYIRRSQQPVCLMVGEPQGWERHVILVNDTLKNVVGSYKIWDADTGTAATTGRFAVAADGRSDVAALPVITGERKMLLLSWQLDSGETGVNHYLCGTPAFDLAQYRHWLTVLARLDNTFEPDKIGQ